MSAMAALGRGVLAAVCIHATKDPRPGDIWRLRSALDRVGRDELARGIEVWCDGTAYRADAIIATVDRVIADIAKETQIQALMDRCCCHPDQPRGHHHG